MVLPLDRIPRNLDTEAPAIEADATATRIFCAMTARAVGDLILMHVFAASTKLLFDNAKLFIYQRDDRKLYKRDILNLNAHADFALVIDDSHPGISIDSLSAITDILSNEEPLPDYFFKHPQWLGQNCNLPNIVLTPSCMRDAWLASFDSPAFLSIPEERTGELTDRLVAAGVDPNRWFCCIHYREPGYDLRPSRFLRDLDPRPFMALTEDIIENLGGQVVRVGHPKMTPFPKRPGFIDLAMLEDSFMLHAFAVSRARFMVGSLSGISHAGSAFNTPTVITNNSDPTYSPGCWRDHDVSLYLNVYAPSGRRLSVEELAEAGVLGSRNRLTALRNEKGFKVYQNSPAELGAVARRLLQATTECPGWREPSATVVSSVRPNKFVYPMSTRNRVPVVEYPDLAFKPV
jgi:putative glycosyltransferase (TIGR04372 family)